MNEQQNKALKQLQNLIKAFGYWSNEVNTFNSKLDYKTMVEINNIAKP